MAKNLRSGRAVGDVGRRLGATLEDALHIPEDGTVTVLRVWMERDKDLSTLSPIRRGEHLAAPARPSRGKASVYTAWRSSGLSKIKLAERMGRAKTTCDASSTRTTERGSTDSTKPPEPLEDG